MVFLPQQTAGNRTDSEGFSERVWRRGARGWCSRRCKLSAILGRPELEQERHSPLRPVSGRWISRGRAAETTSQHLGVDNARIEGDRRQVFGQFLRQRQRKSFNRPLARAVR